VRRRDGKPAYQICSLVDDLHYEVDLIVRGDDLLASSMLQSCLSAFLPANRFRDCVFFHHPLLKQEGLKMSKSAGSNSIHDLRKRGKKRGDIFRQLALLAGVEPIATDHAGLYSQLEIQLGLG
jgi:glutamyl-Q tRNA(Asp) synthetase